MRAAVRRANNRTWSAAAGGSRTAHAVENTRGVLAAVGAVDRPQSRAAFFKRSQDSRSELSARIEKRFDCGAKPQAASGQGLRTTEVSAECTPAAAFCKGKRQLSRPPFRAFFLPESRERQGAGERQ